MLTDAEIEEFVAKYVEGREVIGVGSGRLGEELLKKIALRAEEKELGVKVVPTSSSISVLVSQLGLETTSLDEHELDLGVEFVQQADEGFNFLKRESNSLVRDKMVAQSAKEMIVVTAKENFVKKLSGIIPFEVCKFGWKRTLVQLENLGSAKLREEKGKPFRTESGNFLIDVLVDEVYSEEELEFSAKEIPGVLETGLFIGYADRVVLHNDEITVKSRIENK